MKRRTTPLAPGQKAAAALQYRQDEDRAPRVVAKGRGIMAERIIAAAREAGVPLHEDPDLVAMLLSLDVNATIPPDLYMAVAEVLAFVYRVNAARRARTDR